MLLANPNEQDLHAAKLCAKHEYILKCPKAWRSQTGFACSSFFEWLHSSFADDLIYNIIIIIYIYICIRMQLTIALSASLHDQLSKKGGRGAIGISPATPPAVTPRLLGVASESLGEPRHLLGSPPIERDPKAQTNSDVWPHRRGTQRRRSFAPRTVGTPKESPGRTQDFKILSQFSEG